MPTITVLPLGRALTVERGTLLRDALQSARIMLDYPCGGKGSCRQCRVNVDPPPAAGKGGLRESDCAAGIRLACQLPISDDCTITIPETRSSRQVWKQGMRDTDIDVVMKSASVWHVEVTLAEPDLEDQRADWERLSAGLAERGIFASAPDPVSLERLSRVLREGGWKIDAVCEENELLALESSPSGRSNERVPSGRSNERVPSGRSYGFAVDLGTTTVDLALLDLESGKRLARRAFLNGQVSFGADVISRAQSFHDERIPVREAALRTIDEGARGMLEEAGIPAGRVVKTVVVGNPIMIHILNGIDPFQLTHVPYVPLIAGSVRSAPQSFGWTFQEHGYVETLPLVSAYVGADTIGMIVALDLEAERTTTLSIDIGTNGEMVLARTGKLLATSTAAGPAFEGAQISCGMRALDGAIRDVAISGDGRLRLQVVGGGAPRGLCGTGLISGIAELLSRGVVDETGRIVDPADVEPPALRERIFLLGNEPAFSLSEDRGVYISQNDIRKLQLAKGAVRTGIETLLEASGLRADMLDALRLAGNFGAGLDAGAAMRIGLIPPMDLERVRVVGNAALRGAIMVLLSRDCWRKSQSAARNTRFVELGGKPEFQARFMDSMMF
jgi:uncharacterized 2Fe-2S/4Fe-4S cluster protein (DUF4445 family)